MKKSTKIKRKINKFNKKIYTIIIFIIVVLAIISPEALDKIENAIIGKSSENVIQKEITENEYATIEINKEKPNILFLDVGQADSEIIFYKDSVMIIDTGNNEDGNKIIEFLKENNITKIDYLIGTHIHEDHIGSMQYFINEFEIGEIYLPKNEKNVTLYYKNLLTNILNKNMQINVPEVGEKIMLNELEFEVMAVDNEEPEDENDESIVLEMRYGENKILFTGDATKRVEEKRNWSDIDILKVGHHGSDTSSSKKFIKQVSPEISIISVGKDNSYNLPKDKIIKLLQENGSKIYRTDFDGTIQVICDENKYEINKIDRSFDGNN